MSRGSVKALDANGAAPPEGPESGPAANGRVLQTRGRGYLLEVAAGELDPERFRDLADRGRDALAPRRPDEAATTLRKALGGSDWVYPCSRCVAEAC
jgi:hypothetical protein